MHYPKVTAILRDYLCAIDACLIDFILFFDICSILQQICVNIIILICAFNFVEDPKGSSYYFTWKLLLEIPHFLPLIDKLIFI